MEDKGGSAVSATVEVSHAVASLWGKSSADGKALPLLQHLFDTAAVGELLWDDFLSAHQRDIWEEATRGRGRDFFTLLCGLHDVGKATPAFQSKSSRLAAQVIASGLSWQRLSTVDTKWYHTLAGAHLVRTRLPGMGWDHDAVAGLWPFVAGHHGVVPSARDVLAPPGRGRGHGKGRHWEAAQTDVLERVASALEIDLPKMGDLRYPSRAAQLALLGSLIMADWIASNDAAFPGCDEEITPSLELGRTRAQAGWDMLGLRPGWRQHLLTTAPDPIAARFGIPARPIQQAVVDVASSVPRPPLLIVEAPMGEGKTEAALAAAEVLARRFGCTGVFVGMPTQATSDPMFSRVRHWSNQIDPQTSIALLHGKARFNPEWRQLREAGVRITGVDEYGMADDYGQDQSTCVGGQTPAEWFLGRKRGLLTPVVVGTVDQLLHAATRTRHVMLRHAGLAGKVVILDEVHAYDIYMSQFLFEALRWLADAGVPVVLLSATLPPSLRAELVRAYAQGLTGLRYVDVPNLPARRGYPEVVAVSQAAGQLAGTSRTADPWREALRVEVAVLPEGPDGSDAAIGEELAQALIDGGVALVVRDTVGRAQHTYVALRERFGADVELLHGRLTAGQRATRSQSIVDRLGPPGRVNGPERPSRLIVVATQVAEQSFDVDVDVLITDIAPIDLLLQRVGRLHRHQRPLDSRPARVRQPRVLVTGFAPSPTGPPVLARGCTAVYGHYLLLRAAHLVLQAAGQGWAIPTDVPRLVAAGYDPTPPPSGWEAALSEAKAEWDSRQAGRRDRARQFLLAGEDNLDESTLAGLHERDIAELPDDDAVAAVVRDGDESIEVILVKQSDRGLTTLDGRPLGVNGEAVSDSEVLEAVLRDSLRLPSSLTQAALVELGPLPGWIGDPWLGRTRVVILDSDGQAQLGGWRIHYTDELGIHPTWEGT